VGIAWNVTPDVGRHDEAIDWFGKRVVMTAVEARKLDDDEKVNAFWVGGGLHLTQVQRVFDKIKNAVERGDSLDDFKKNVLTELRNPAHVETVFRNATQRSYNAGRWAQMREPSVAKFRPYWLFDALLDPRTTEICEICGGTLLPHDHPWWKTHVPPLHHRCRSCIRNLRRSEAEKRGITQKLPGKDGDPRRGWGQEPSAADPWKPDPAKHDAQLLLDFGAKETWAVKKRKPRTPSKPKEKPKLDVETWIPVYEPIYGADVAKSLAHGKAALEHGLDLPVKEVRKQLSKLDSPGTTAMLEACEDCDEQRTLREQAGEKEPLRKAAAALAGHLRTLPKRAKLTNRSLALKPEGKAALEYFSKVTGPNAGSLPEALKAIPIKKASGSYFDAKAGHVVYTSRVGALHHELAHVLEHYADADLIERVREFLRQRVDGYELENLGRNGLCWKDEFYQVYTGRRYPLLRDEPGKSPDPNAPVQATEVLSTGVELLFANDTFWGTLEDWVRFDPEHFYFVLGQLAGK
jgi:SPP1 gp7 family putative phage head morphogenesis protein